MAVYRQVSIEEAEAKAGDQNVMFIETSAKAGFNIKVTNRLSNQATFLKMTSTDWIGNVTHKYLKTIVLFFSLPSWIMKIGGGPMFLSLIHNFTSSQHQSDCSSLLIISSFYITHFFY